MDIPATLVRARLRAGLSQTVLAARAGTSQATISAYESGRKVPSVETLTRLLGATGCRLAVEAGAARGAPPPGHQRTARAFAGGVSLAGGPAERPPRPPLESGA